MRRRKADFQVLANLSRGKIQVAKVPCKIYLPTRMTNRVLLSFQPMINQLKQVEGLLPMFSLNAEIPSISGPVATTITAEEVWTDRLTSQHWGPEFVDAHFNGKPTWLLISHHISEESAKDRISGRFWISQSEFLAPFQMITQSYTGEVTVKTVRKFGFKFSSGLVLDFDKRYRYFRKRKDENTTLTDLVANFECSSEACDLARFLASIDDFLLLVSLAERYYCLCMGWEATDQHSYSLYYRQNRFLPKSFQKDDTLIDLRDFEDFITKAYAAFSGESVDSREFIRRAIYMTVPAGGRTIESIFVTLFRAVETLLLAYRKAHGFKSALGASEWKGLSVQLRECISASDILKDRPAEKQLLLGKLGDLNRVSFGAALKAFCDHYRVDLRDLWPITGSSGGVSLAGIRNRLVHGEAFSGEKYTAVMAAEMHLKWILERMLLRLFDWEISRSAVSPVALMSMFPYHNWQREQERLSK